MDLSTERLYGLIPQYIPDSCLAGSGMRDRWRDMIVKAFKEVILSDYCNNMVHSDRQPACGSRHSFIFVFCHNNIISLSPIGTVFHHKIFKMIITKLLSLLL